MNVSRLLLTTKLRSELHISSSSVINTPGLNNMNLFNTAAVLLAVGIINDYDILTSCALQFPSPEISRRSAITSIATASSAAAVSGSLPLISLANESVGGPSVVLNSNNKKHFPLASFGLQVYGDDTAYKLTLTALEAGYRNFFASVLAGNQKGFAKVSLSQCVTRWILLVSILIHINSQGYQSLRYIT